jgi:hypothetical protein
MYDVASIGPDDAWAVGVRYPIDGPTVGVSLVEHWDGTAWTSVSVPDVSAVLAVSASGPDDVWALGSRGVLHFDGSWHTTPTPEFGVNQPQALVAVSPHDAWMVGVRYGAMFPGLCGDPDRENLPLVEHWDGSSWVRIDVPRPPVHQSQLIAVAALGPNDVWATGGYARDTPPTGPGNGCANVPDPGSGTVMLHWDGSAWSMAPVPSPGRDAEVRSISVDRQDDAWAIGGSQTVQGAGPVFHWNGAAWTELPPGETPPGRPGTVSRLLALSPDDLWAAGGSIEHWDGSGWSVAGLPGDTAGASFGGIDASAPADVWSVGTTGSDGDGSPSAAVIVHWNGTAWSQVPAAPFPA